VMLMEGRCAVTVGWGRGGLFECTPPVCIFFPAEAPETSSVHLASISLLTEAVSSCDITVITEERGTDNWRVN
jgi:hypothetical protein